MNLLDDDLAVYADDVVEADAAPLLYDDRHVETLTDEQTMAAHFEWAEVDQFELNRRAAGQASRLAEALAFARTHPWVYVDPQRDDAAERAERTALTEASLRLNLSENTVRNLAQTAVAAQEVLPHLWRSARDGFATIAHLECALGQLGRFGDDREAVARFDAALSGMAPLVGPATFRVRAVRLARLLAPDTDAIVHAEAFTKRRVVVEDAGSGMSWLQALVSTTDALAIKRRLTAAAKHLSRRSATGATDTRTRDQVRADLAVAWLRGVGTPTAVKTKVFVTVPLDRLSDRARASVRRRVADAGPGVGTGVTAPTDVTLDSTGLDLSSEALLLGSGPIDIDSATRLLLDAGQFTRVITDPVSGVVLDMERRSRTVTRQQREWLLLSHHLCMRDGCNRAAIDAEIDHWQEFHGPERGPTDLRNLHPLCGSDHALKGTTKVRYRRRPDGSVQLGFPTGFHTGERGRPAPDAASGSEWSRRIAARAAELTAAPEIPDAPPF